MSGMLTKNPSVEAGRVLGAVTLLSVPSLLVLHGKLGHWLTGTCIPLAWSYQYGYQPCTHPSHGAANDSPCWTIQVDQKTLLLLHDEERRKLITIRGPVSQRAGREAKIN